MRGKSSGGGELQQSGQFTIDKDIGPRIVEISLAAHGITLTK
jgi:hypothetical protein